MGKIQLVRDISRTTFIKDFLQESIPCVFKSQFSHLPALTRWVRPEKDDFSGQERSRQALRIDHFLRLISENGRDPFVDVETGRFNPDVQRLVEGQFTSPMQTVSQQTDFTRTEIPLSLFLKIHSAVPESLPESMRNIYLAQTPLLESLPALKSDFLPLPKYLPAEAEKHVYGCSAWIGRNTYTPRHFDPNENLYVMIAGRKKITLWEPEYNTKDLNTSDMEKLNKNRKKGILGNRNFGAAKDGEVEYGHCVLEPGDGLFIPERWWHEVASIEEEFTASVNWWFKEPYENDKITPIEH
ncbi:uncharacterized protein V2V93DRAFT_116765 [Kockiozyma suomiensis]|uniref:uncharacterized protein n=1 Tax=Kockiozyma suomiensis TaxID=1337062 RepID=UPI0033442635